MAKKELQIRTFEITESNMAYHCLNLYFREIYFVVSILQFLNSSVQSSFTVCHRNIKERDVFNFVRKDKFVTGNKEIVKMIFQASGVSQRGRRLGRGCYDRGL